MKCRSRAERGIKVKFIKEADASQYGFYNAHDNKGMVEFRFEGKPLLMVEAVPYYVALNKGEPPKLDVTWDAAAIQIEEAYFESLTHVGEIHDLEKGTARLW
jgi:hypothetical protein